jgi:hypothetical protein
MNLEQFEAEKNYQAARQIIEGFRQQSLLTEEEFVQIDTILLREFRPPLGSLCAEITCFTTPVE